MTMTTRTAGARGIPMDPLRRTAMIVGGLYLLTFASSIPARFFFLDPVLSDPGYIVGPGADTRVLVGGLLDMVNALACIATAVVLFRVVKRQSETLALGFVASRLLEAAIISIGVVSLLAVVTLRQDLAGTTGAEDASLVAVGSSLVAVYEWTFLFGPNVMAAVNALLLGTLMYRSGLVPRAIPLMGLIGAPPAPGVSDRDRPRHPRPGFRAARAGGRPDLRLGVVARRLPGGQGLQALARHGARRRLA